MMSVDAARAILLRRLERRARLDDVDRDAVSALPMVMRNYDPNAYLIREGTPPGKACALLCLGTAFRQKTTINGLRQIVSLHLRGDFLDLQHLTLPCADHNVQALTRLEVAEIDHDRLRGLSFERPTIGMALWTEALIEGSIYREWMTNIGRRDARERLLHLLCELAVRAHEAGLGGDEGYDLPMTQEQLGDATGLTAVHVNRMLRVLEVEGLVTRNKRFVRLVNWERAVNAADFNPSYLLL